MFIDEKSVFFEKYAKDAKHIEVNSSLDRIAIVMNKIQSNIYIFDYKDIQNYSVFEKEVDIDIINEVIKNKKEKEEKDCNKFHNENILECKSDRLTVKDKLLSKSKCSKKLIKKDLDLNFLAKIKIESKDSIKQIKFIKININEDKLKSLGHKSEYLLVLTENCLLLYHPVQLKYFNTNITYKKNSNKSLSSKSIIYDDNKENWVLFNKYNLNLGLLNICYILPNVNYIKNSLNTDEKQFIDLLAYMTSKKFSKEKKLKFNNLNEFQETNDINEDYYYKEHKNYEYDNYFCVYIMNMEFELHIIKVYFKCHQNYSDFEKNMIRVHFFDRFLGITLNTTITCMLVTNDSKFIYFFNSLGIIIYSINNTHSHNKEFDISNLENIDLHLTLLICLDYEEIVFHNCINKKEILENFSNEYMIENEEMDSLDVTKLLKNVNKNKNAKNLKKEIKNLKKNESNEQYFENLKEKFIRELKRKTEKARINYFANNTKLTDFNIDIDRDLDKDEYQDLIEKININSIDNDSQFKNEDKLNSKILKKLLDKEQSNIIINDTSTLEDYNNFFECSQSYFSKYEKYFIVSFFNIKSNLYYLLVVDNFVLKNKLHSILKNKILNLKEGDVFSKQYTEITEMSRSIFFNETELILDSFKIILSSKFRVHSYFSNNTYFKNKKNLEFDILDEYISNSSNINFIFDKIYKGLELLNNDLNNKNNSILINNVEENMKKNDSK